MFWLVAVCFAKELVHEISGINRSVTTTKLPYRYAAGEVLHWPVFWISNLFEATAFPFRYHQMGLSDKNISIISCRVQHGFSFWLSNLLQPIISGQPLAQRYSSSQSDRFPMTPSEPSSIPHSHDQHMNHIGSTLPTEIDLLGLMCPFVFADVDPFDSIFSDSFCPLATSSPRGSSPNAGVYMSDILANNTSFESDLDPIAIGYSEDVCKAADSPMVLFGVDGDTLVNTPGNESPFPRCFSSSSKPRPALWIKTIDLGEKSAPLSTPESASTGSSPSNILVPGLLGVSSHSSKVKNCNDRPHSSRGTESVTSNFRGSDAVVPSSAVNARADSGKRISRDPASAVLDIFKPNSKVHVRTRPGSKRFTDAHFPFHDASMVFHEPIDSVNQVYIISDAEVSESRLFAIEVGSSPQLETSGPPLPFSPARHASSTTSQVEEAPVEVVFIDNNVRRMAVGKTRIFEDAFKRATASLRPEKLTV